MHSLPDDEQNELAPRRPSPENRFETVFQRLLSGENLDLYAEGVSVMFEVIAANLMAEIPAREYHWFDGIVELEAARRKSGQIEFTGEMWVGDIGNTRMQWKEDFRATVTDKQITKQGIWVVLYIGSDRAEADLPSAFGVNQEK